MKTEIVNLGKHHIGVYSEDDVEDTLERNHVLRGIPQKSDWGRHIGTIPAIILVKWLNEEWNRGNTKLKCFSKEFDKLVARKLEDPEWKYLRVDK